MLLQSGAEAAGGAARLAVGWARPKEGGAGRWSDTELTPCTGEASSPAALLLDTPTAAAASRS